MRQSRGFTLVELLVAMSIIALLSSVVFAVLTSARKKARDAQRISQAQQVAKALELAFVDSGSYALPNTGLSAEPGEGYVAKRSSDDASYFASSIIDSLKSRGYIAAAEMRDQVYGLNNYYLSQCGASSLFVIYMKVEQQSLQIPANTLVSGCDGANAVALGFNYAVSAGGMQGLVASGEGSGASWSGSSWSYPTGASGKVVGDVTTYPLLPGSGPFGIAYDGANMWVTNNLTDSVSKISATGTITTYGPTGVQPRFIAFDGTNMWVVNTAGSSVSKVTPAGAITTYPGTGNLPQGIAFDGTNMWVVSVNDRTVTKVSPSGAMTPYGTTGVAPRCIAFDGANMWTINTSDNTTTKISATGTMVTYPGLPANSYGIAFDGANMWTVTNNTSNTAAKISSTGVVTPYAGTGSTPYGLVFDGVNMWSANNVGNSVTRISPTGAMTTFPGTGAGPFLLAYDGTHIWTANYSDNSVSKIVAR